MGLLTEIRPCHNFTPAPQVGSNSVNSDHVVLNKMPYVLVDRGWLGLCYIRTGLGMMDLHGTILIGQNGNQTIGKVKNIVFI